MAGWECTKPNLPGLSKIVAAPKPDPPKMRYFWRIIRHTPVHIFEESEQYNTKSLSIYVQVTFVSNYFLNYFEIAKTEQLFSGV